ncbi:MAG: hypothetical protein IJD48_04055, partial [Clostridia bacterium]|nr:hypothetical protein [Clostridia bacterium]
MWNILLIGILALAISIPLIVYRDKIGQNKITKLIKILAISVFALSIFRNFLNDAFMLVINGGETGGVYYKTADVLQSLIRWGMGFIIVVNICAIFYQKRTMRNFAIYVGFPIALLALASYDRFIEYFVTDVDRGFMTAEWFRHFEFSLELIMLLVIPILLRFGVGHKFDVKSKSEWLHFVGILP